MELTADSDVHHLNSVDETQFRANETSLPKLYKDFKVLSHIDVDTCDFSDDFLMRQAVMPVVFDIIVAQSTA